MSTTIDTMRTNIKAGIANISGLSTIEIVDAAIPEHAFGIALRKPAIALCYTGITLRGQDTISTIKQSIVFGWQLVLVTESWRSPAAAVNQSLGIEEIAERLRGTPGIEDGLRAVEVATISGDGLRLRFASERVLAPPGRPEEAGPAALTQQWYTWPEITL